MDGPAWYSVTINEKLLTKKTFHMTHHVTSVNEML